MTSNELKAAYSVCRDFENDNAFSARRPRIHQLGKADCGVKSIIWSWPHLVFLAFRVS